MPIGSASEGTIWSSVHEEPIDKVIDELIHLQLDVTHGFTNFGDKVRKLECEVSELNLKIDHMMAALIPNFNRENLLNPPESPNNEGEANTSSHPETTSETSYWTTDSLTPYSLSSNQIIKEKRDIADILAHPDDDIFSEISGNGSESKTQKVMIDTRGKLLIMAPQTGVMYNDKTTWRDIEKKFHGTHLEFKLDNRNLLMDLDTLVIEKHRRLIVYFAHHLGLHFRLNLFNEEYRPNVVFVGELSIHGFPKKLVYTADATWRDAFHAIRQDPFFNKYNPNGKCEIADLAFCDLNDMSYYYRWELKLCEKPKEVEICIPYQEVTVEIGGERGFPSEHLPKLQQLIKKMQIVPLVIESITPYEEQGKCQLRVKIYCPEDISLNFKEMINRAWRESGSGNHQTLSIRESNVKRIPIKDLAAKCAEFRFEPL